MTEELWALNAREVAAAIRAKVVRPREVVESVLRRIEDVDPLVAAIATVADGALEEADEAERALLRGDALGPLHGVPVTVKDLLATEGIPTARGMLGLAGTIPDADAPSVALVRRAGAIVVAKTTTCELGHKAVTDGADGRATANPWALDRTAGGSSGGAAAALATGIAPLAIATDGGGSIRIPASFCGLVGMKPTSGLVPTYPPSRLGPLGHTGPMARTVEDLAVLLSAMTGATSSGIVHAQVSQPLEGRRVAYAATINGLPVEPEVRAVVERAVSVLESAGAYVEPIELTCVGFEEAWETLYVSGVLADFQGLDPAVAATSGEGLLRLIDAARSLSPGAGQRAEADRVVLVHRLTDRLAPFHLVALPSVAVTAFPLGMDDPPEIDGVPVPPRAWWRLSQLWNLSGMPAMSVPAGRSSTGLPVGLQLVGRVGQDAAVLAAAAAYEHAAGWQWHPVDPVVVP